MREIDRESFVGHSAYENENLRSDSVSHIKDIPLAGIHQSPGCWRGYGERWECGVNGCGSILETFPEMSADARMYIQLGRIIDQRHREGKNRGELTREFNGNGRNWCWSGLCLRWGNLTEE
ncbi:uncharacterized protein LOC135160290 isoform X4 [Diachasmimorpha longicaudata]|uniref:uncharacterized protein LOC135160290 isoform X4 n=1 Tax=Diachasmimorpha longicaudata TaxID=58733 RepID=UPI0030B8DFEF